MAWVLPILLIWEPANARAATISASSVSAPSSIEQLVAEAMRSSPEIAAARSHFVASTKAPIQAGTLENPQISLQEFTVGSPAPASGYETSDFYYTGFGLSQDIPGPGKLRLRSKRAEKETKIARAEVESVERRVAQRVRETAADLFYLTHAREILQQTRGDLIAVARAAERQYRAGTANQQDVLKAELAATSILKDLETNRADMSAAEAVLKAMLGREQDSPDIEIGEIAPTAMEIDPARLGERADESSAELRMARAMVESSADALELARRDYWPDFTVGYQYLKTGPGFRDYYMLTVGAKIPLYFWRKQTPAVEQAAAEKAAAENRLRSAWLETASDLRSEAAAARGQEKVISLYRQALIPQAEATLESARAAYRAGKVDFQTLLSAETDLLNLRQGYFRAIADHEKAIARIRQIVGDPS
jgi:outer membrane protein TolC